MKAVISGATRGIGKSIANGLAKEGYNLVLLARNEEQLNACREELLTHSIEVDVLAIDLASPNSLDLLHKQSSLFENTTLLVNNLGVYSTTESQSLSVGAIQSQIDSNLYSAVQLSNLILGSQKNSLRNIINIGSVMSLEAASFASDYSISKHAFKAWNDSLRESLRKEGINVSIIYPGAVSTSSWDGIPVDRSQMIQATDIAEAALCILKMSPNTLLEEIRISPRDFQA